MNGDVKCIIFSTRRPLWERAVEDAVAPVVRRFQNKVNTKGLSKLTALTVEDCKIMREAYERCSELLHR